MLNRINILQLDFSATCKLARVLAEAPVPAPEQLWQCHLVLAAPWSPPLGQKLPSQAALVSAEENSCVTLEVQKMTNKR